MPECFICGGNGRGMPLERHHCIGAALRKKSEKYGLVVRLCHWCHNEPPNGVHHNAKSRKIVQQWAQRKAMADNNWTTADFIKHFGKNYLED